MRVRFFPYSKSLWWTRCHMSAHVFVFFQEHTSDKALVWHHLRFPPIRLPKAEGEDRPLGGAKVKGGDSSYIRHTPPPTGCGLLLSSLLQPDWCMTNSLMLLHTRESIRSTFKHTPRLLPDVPGPPHSHRGFFRGAEAQQTCITVNYGSEVYFLPTRNICMVCII